jgi:hypothetical protein
MNKKSFILRYVIIFICTGALAWAWVALQQLDTQDYHYFGLPLKYYESGGMCVNGLCPSVFSLGNLIIDIFVWMAVSLGTTLLSVKIKK